MPTSDRIHVIHVRVKQKWKEGGRRKKKACKVGNSNLFITPSQISSQTYLTATWLQDKIWMEARKRGYVELRKKE